MLISEQVSVPFTYQYFNEHYIGSQVMFVDVGFTKTSSFLISFMDESTIKLVHENHKILGLRDLDQAVIEYIIKNYNIMPTKIDLHLL